MPDAFFAVQLRIICKLVVTNLNLLVQMVNVSNTGIIVCLFRMKRNESCSSISNFVHYDFLQQKLKGLEEENRKLRLEVR